MAKKKQYSREIQSRVWKKNWQKMAYGWNSAKCFRIENRRASNIVFANQRESNHFVGKAERIENKKVEWLNSN